MQNKDISDISLLVLGAGFTNNKHIILHAQTANGNVDIRG